MSKKKIWIALAIMVVVALVLTYLFYDQTTSDEYMPAEDEMELHIQLNTKEDVGLLVFDYRADDAEYSGGISNANKSLLKQNSDNVQIWNKQELDTYSDTVEMWIQFRVITEYVEPNYENNYPEDITKYLYPISWKAQFGKSYYITITGDKENGYKAVLNQ